MEYLEEKLRLINDGSIKDETDTKMMNIYQSKILQYIYQEKWLVVYLSLQMSLRSISVCTIHVSNHNVLMCNYLVY